MRLSGSTCRKSQIKSFFLVLIDWNPNRVTFSSYINFKFTQHFHDFFIKTSQTSKTRKLPATIWRNFLNFEKFREIVTFNFNLKKFISVECSWPFSLQLETKNRPKPAKIRFSVQDQFLINFYDFFFFLKITKLYSPVNHTTYSSLKTPSCYIN